MNAQVLAALQSLGLSEDTDGKAVRRAYAAQLKQIDVAAEPARFQALRERYELVLAWLAHRDAAARDAPDQTPASPEEAAPTPAAPASGPVDNAAAPSRMQRSDDYARAVFDALMARLAAAGTLDRHEARAALDAALEDPQLLDVDARFLFELGVASWLANGWRPGHEKVFAPAVGAFRWREEAASLSRLGRSGVIIDHAIQELDAYDSLPEATRERLREPIRQLRSPDKPGVRRLAKSLPLAEQAVRNFPHWLHIVTNPSNIERWRAWEAAIPAWRRFVAFAPARPKARPVPTGNAASASNPWMVVMCLVGMMGLASTLSRLSTPPAPAPAPHRTLAPLPRAPSAPAASFPALAPSSPLPLAAAPARPPAPTAPAIAPAALVQQPYATLPEARKLAASLGKGKADVLKCNDAIRILELHTREFEKGSFGRSFDSLMINCLMGKLAMFPYPLIDRAIKREFGRRAGDATAGLSEIRGLSPLPVMPRPAPVRPVMASPPSMTMPSSDPSAPSVLRPQGSANPWAVPPPTSGP